MKVCKDNIKQVIEEINAKGRKVLLIFDWPISWMDEDDIELITAENLKTEELCLRQPVLEGADLVNYYHQLRILVHRANLRIASLPENSIERAEIEEVAQLFNAIVDDHHQEIYDR